MIIHNFTKDIIISKQMQMWDNLISKERFLILQDIGNQGTQLLHKPGAALVINI